MIDFDAIRAAVDLRGECERAGVVFSRAGMDWVGLCPFHQERTPSFTLHGEGAVRAHCFGCGWSGDVLDFWMEQRGMHRDSKEGRKEAIAALTGGMVRTDAPVKVRAATGRVQGTLEGRKKPYLGPMRRLRAAEYAQLGKLRGLEVASLEAAAGDGRLGFAEWPYDKGDGRKGKPSWVVTDGERWTAQFRPLDGSGYEGREGTVFKSYSMKNVCWPVGAAQGVERERIVITEGGADMLAAYELALKAGVLGEVSIWAIFGASVKLCREGLGYARGRRVRIFADHDESKVKEFRYRPAVSVRAGWEAAGRWSAQLHAAGAVVDVYDLEPLLDGKPGDLNDVVRMGTGRLDLAHFFDF